LMRHGPHRKKMRPIILLLFCVYSLPRERFTEPLPSNDSGIFIEPLFSNDRGYKCRHRLMGGFYEVCR
jgi:hypothetical protein